MTANREREMEIIIQELFELIEDKSILRFDYFRRLAGAREKAEGLSILRPKEGGPEQKGGAVGA